MKSDPGGRPGIIGVGGYVFEGPFNTPLELEDRPGVYVILDVKGSSRRIIDVGEASAVMSRVMDHNRKVCWIRKSKGILKVAVHYTHPAQPLGRKQIKDAISRHFLPPCRSEE